ncbi:hypothetical protein ACS6YY_05585 [Streptococcus suis]
MNCVDYQPNKKCPYINSPFYEIRIIIAQALINNQGKYSELVKEYNDLVRKSNQNIETLEELEKENKSLKNEIKGIYKGFNQFMENTLGATVGQAKKLMNNLMSEVKEFVKGGEFEKIHRNETKTRDRDELFCGNLKK